MIWDAFLNFNASNSFLIAGDLPPKLQSYVDEQNAWIQSQAWRGAESPRVPRRAWLTRGFRVRPWLSRQTRTGSKPTRSGCKRKVMPGGPSSWLRRGARQA
jgi:hypothetical protein